MSLMVTVGETMRKVQKGAAHGLPVLARVGLDVDTDVVADAEPVYR